MDIGWKSFIAFAITGLIIFVVNFLFKKHFSKKEKSDESEKVFVTHARIDLNFIIIALLALIFIGATTWDYFTLYTQAVEHGYTNMKNIYDFYRAIRNIYTSNFVHFNFNPLLTFTLAIQKMISYAFTYVFVINTVIYGFKLKDLKFLATLPSFFVYMFLTSGRTEFIGYFVFVALVIVFSIVATSNTNSTIDRVFVLASLLTIFVLGGTIFIYLDSIVGGSSSRDIFEYIYKYFGVPYYAVELLLDGKMAIDRSLFGSHTLYTIYSFLSTLGFNVPELPNSYLPSIEEHGFNTNIYAAIGRWYFDYDWAGMFILTAAWFSLYSFYFYKFVNHKKIGIHIMMYAYFIYPIIMFATEDGFFPTFTLGMAYKFPIFILIYILVVRRYHYKTLVEDFYVDSKNVSIKENVAVVIIGNQLNRNEWDIIDKNYSKAIKLNNGLPLYFVNECEPYKQFVSLKEVTSHELSEELKTKDVDKCLVIRDDTVLIETITDACFFDAIGAMNDNNWNFLVYDSVTFKAYLSRPICNDFKANNAEFVYKGEPVLVNKECFDLINETFGSSMPSSKFGAPIRNMAVFRAILKDGKYLPISRFCFPRGSEMHKAIIKRIK